MEFSKNISIGNRILKKLVDEKMQFSGEHLLDFYFYFDKELVIQIFINSACILATEDMEDLACEVKEDLIFKLCKEAIFKNGM